MKLNNPPVTQTWIGFTFQPGDRKRAWNVKEAGDFLARFDDQLPHREGIFETQYQIQDISPVDRPAVMRREIIDKAIAHNEDRTHWLQLAEDRLVYNRTRGDGAYLGFESLRDEAINKLEDYVEFFGPSTLLSAELHYVDQIEIPIPPEKNLDLKDYFQLRVEIPGEHFGPTWYFSTRLFLRPPIDGDILEVRFQSEPPLSDATSYRFRFDWHMVCPGIAAFEREAVEKRLNQAHRCLTDYFRASVTDRTWALFLPSEEG